MAQNIQLFCVIVKNVIFPSTKKWRESHIPWKYRAQFVNTCVPEPRGSFGTNAYRLTLRSKRLLTFPMNLNLKKRMYFRVLTVESTVRTQSCVFRAPRLFPVGKNGGPSVCFLKTKCMCVCSVELHLFFVARLRLAFSASDCANTLANKVLRTAE